MKGALIGGISITGLMFFGIHEMNMKKYKNRMESEEREMASRIEMMKRVEKIEKDILSSDDSMVNKMQSEEMKALDMNIKRYINAHNKLKDYTNNKNNK